MRIKAETDHADRALGFAGAIGERWKAEDPEPLLLLGELVRFAGKLKADQAALVPHLRMLAQQPGLAWLTRVIASLWPDLGSPSTAEDAVVERARTQVAAFVEPARWLRLRHDASVSAALVVLRDKAVDYIQLWRLGRPSLYVSRADLFKVAPAMRAMTPARTVAHELLQVPHDILAAHCLRLLILNKVDLSQVYRGHDYIGVIRLKKLGDQGMKPYLLHDLMRAVPLHRKP